MENRKIQITYKNTIIHGYKGSNYAYIGNRIFPSVISAKRHITKMIKHTNQEMLKRITLDSNINLC